MRHHRIIWTITAVVVLVAAAVVATRASWRESTGEGPPAPRTDTPAVPVEPVSPPAQPPQPPVQPPSPPDDYDKRLDAMFAALDRDPRAWLADTQTAVENVAVLAEQHIVETAETHYALALRLMGQQHYGEAEHHYRESIQLQPNWSWPYNGLGILLHRTGRKEEARQAFDKAMELAPEWSRPHNDLAILLRMDGRLEEAQEEAWTALQLGPEEAATHNNYANLLVVMGKLVEAELYYCRAIELDPQHPKPYYNVACVCSLQGDTQEALFFLRKAIRLNDQFLERAKTDPDLETVRELPAFRELVGEDTTETRGRRGQRRR